MSSIRGAPGLIVGQADSGGRVQRVRAFALRRLAPLGSAQIVVSHRRMLWRMTRTEMSTRFAGSFLGAAWVLVTPALILAIYSVTYLEIFRVRVVGLSSIAYVLYILCGLVPFLASSEALSVGVASVVASKGVLNNTVFPIDLAPIRALLISQGTMVVGMTAVLAGAAGDGRIRWTVALLPVIWLLNVLWLAGSVWILSLLNVLIRDLQAFMTALLMMMMIASPFAYTPSMIPPALRPLLAVNPFAYFVVAYQQVVVLGTVPTLLHAIALVVISLVTFLVGSWFFARAKGVIIDYV